MSKQPQQLVEPPENLIACPVCLRKFNKDRVEVHQMICQKLKKRRQRRPWNSQEQRLNGTDHEMYFRRSLPRPKPPNRWRQRHEDTLLAIQHARLCQQHLRKGGNVRDLPPLPPSNANKLDYKECPHCGRKFNEHVAERHIPKCQFYEHNKPRLTNAWRNKIIREFNKKYGTQGTSKTMKNGQNAQRTIIAHECGRKSPIIDGTSWLSIDADKIIIGSNRPPYLSNLKLSSLTNINDKKATMDSNQPPRTPDREKTNLFYVLKNERDNQIRKRIKKLTNKIKPTSVSSPNLNKSNSKINKSSFQQKKPSNVKKSISFNVESDAGRNVKGSTSEHAPASPNFKRTTSIYTNDKSKTIKVNSVQKLPKASNLKRPSTSGRESSNKKMIRENTFTFQYIPKWFNLRQWQLNNENGNKKIKERTSRRNTSKTSNSKRSTSANEDGNNNKMIQGSTVQLLPKPSNLKRSNSTSRERKMIKENPSQVLLQPSNVKRSTSANENSKYRISKESTSNVQPKPSNLKSSTSINEDSSNKMIKGSASQLVPKPSNVKRSPSVVNEDSSNKVAKESVSQLVPKPSNVEKSTSVVNEDGSNKVVKRNTLQLASKPHKVKRSISLKRSVSVTVDDNNKMVKGNIVQLIVKPSNLKRPSLVNIKGKSKVIQESASENTLISSNLKRTINSGDTNGKIMKGTTVQHAAKLLSSNITSLYSNINKVKGSARKSVAPNINKQNLTIKNKDKGSEEIMNIVSPLTLNERPHSAGQYLRKVSKT